MADIVVAEGYAAVGYDYINVDDCWLEKDRDFNGQLVPDRQRFPYGMKSLADYVIWCYLPLKYLISPVLSFGKCWSCEFSVSHI